jgi:hypothetical protein
MDGLGYPLCQQVFPFLSPVPGHVPFFPSFTVILVRCFVGATDSTPPVLYHTCHCSGAIPLFGACARRVGESELGLGVGEDKDVDGYAIKTVPQPIFLMMKRRSWTRLDGHRLQLQVYGPSHSLTPPLVPLMRTSHSCPTQTQR